MSVRSRKWLLALGVIVLTGCGSTIGGPAPAPSGQSSAAPASPSSTSSQKAELLFAASEGNPCGLGCAGTVAIVGLDGRVRAKATFTPPAEPLVGCEGSFVVSSVQVAAGSVYYLDSGGVVHRLRASGQNQVVARFPLLTSQQVTWFAISPDGTKLMASIVAFPPLVSPTTNPSQGCPEHVQGDVRQELVAATTGGPTTTVVVAQPLPLGKGPPPGLIAVVGWDRLGPVAVTDTHMAFIGFVDGTIWSGPASHLDAQGRPGSQVGGADCNPLFGELPDGRLVCYDPKHPTVKDAAGNILWKLKPLDPNDNFTYGNIALSPDASRVAFTLNSNCCYVFDSSVIRSRDGVRIGLGASFQPLGWLDNETLIGVKGTVKSTCSGCPPNFVADNMALVRLATPTKIEDLGFKGVFLGVVQGP